MEAHQLTQINIVINGVSKYETGRVEGGGSIVGAASILYIEREREKIGFASVQ